MSEASCFWVVHPSVHVVMLYLRTQWWEFHQTLVDDVVEVTDELVRF